MTEKIIVNCPKCGRAVVGRTTIDERLLGLAGGPEQREAFIATERAAFLKAAPGILAEACPNHVDAA